MKIKENKFTPLKAPATARLRNEDSSLSAQGKVETLGNTPFRLCWPGKNVSFLDSRSIKILPGFPQSVA